MVDARVVRALDLYFEGPELSSRSKRYVHDSPEFKSSATLVNSQLVCLLKVVLFCFFFFNHVMSDSTTFFFYGELALQSAIQKTQKILENSHKERG